MDNIGVRCYDCYQSAIATVAKYFGCDYPLVALGKIGFDYNLSASAFVGERIHSYTRRKILDFEELIGIRQISHALEKESEKELIAYLKNKQPILVWTDLYNCYWNQAFRKYHFSHCYLLNGYKEGKNSAVFLAQDSYFDESTINQSFEQIIEMANIYYTFEVYEKMSDSKARILQEIRRDAEYYLSTNNAKNIRKFAADMKNVNLKEESRYPDNDLYAVPLLDNLKVVGDRREAYSILISHMNEASGGNMQNISYDLHLCYKKWELVRILLIKKIISSTQQEDMSAIVNILRQIAEIEEKSFEELLKKI